MLQKLICLLILLWHIPKANGIFKGQPAEQITYKMHFLYVCLNQDSNFLKKTTTKTIVISFSKTAYLLRLDI